MRRRQEHHEQADGISQNRSSHCDLKKCKQTTVFKDIYIHRNIRNLTLIVWVNMPTQKRHTCDNNVRRSLYYALTSLS